MMKVTVVTPRGSRICGFRTGLERIAKKIRAVKAPPGARRGGRPEGAARRRRQPAPPVRTSFRTTCYSPACQSVSLFGKRPLNNSFGCPKVSGRDYEEE